MAASQSNIRAGGAYIEIAEKGVEQVKRKLDSLGKSFNAMGNSIASSGTKIMAWTGAALTALGASAKLFANMGAGLSDMSARTGVGVNALSLLKYAAEQSGTSIETLETVIKKTNKAMAEAMSNPKGDMAELFKQMGISVEQLAAMTPEDRIYAISDAMAGLNDDMQEFASMKLFKSTEAMPFLSQGSKVIQGKMGEGKDKGVGLTDEDGRLADELDDSFASLKASTMSVVAAIGSALAPVIIDLITQVTPIAKQVSEWIKENKGLVVSLAKAMVIGFGLGASLFVLGKAIVLVGAGFSALSMALGGGMALIKGAVAVFGFLKTAVMLIPTALKWLAVSLKSLLLLPITWVIAALATFGAYMAYVSLEIGKAELKIQTFGGLMAELKGIFAEAWGGIVDALKSGDIVLAMKIVWAGLKLAFVAGINYLLGQWIAFKHGFNKIMIEAWYGIAGTITNGWNSLKVGIVNITSFFKSTWASVFGWFQDMFSTIVKKLGKAALWSANKLGFLSDDEYKVAADILEQTGEESKKQRTDKLKAIDDEKDAKLEALEEERNLNLEALDDAKQSEIDAVNEASNARLAELEANKNKLKQELTDLTNKAKTVTQDIHKEKDYVPGGGDAANGGLADIAKSKLSSAGTFSAYGAQALGGVRNAELSVLKQISERAERQAKILMKIEARKALGMV